MYSVTSYDEEQYRNTITNILSGNMCSFSHYPSLQTFHLLRYYFSPSLVLVVIEEASEQMLLKAHSSRVVIF